MADYERLVEIQQHLSLAKPDHYLTWYYEYLRRSIDKPIKLLELGIAEGSSLMMWSEFLPNAEITGLDLDPVDLDDAGGRVATYAGEQQDKELLDRIGRERAPEGFDVIIDDASHLGEFSKISFFHLFENHLRPGGLYFFEDWGTAYWDCYPDGKHSHPPTRSVPMRERLFGAMSASELIQGNSFLRRATNKLRLTTLRRSFPSHQRGTVGVLKQIIDECGVLDITDPERGRGPKAKQLISSVHIRPGLALIHKTDPEQGLFQLPPGAWA
ncbi:MAG: hypothetical protein WCB63_20710 [Polyangiales bacterium]